MSPDSALRLERRRGAVLEAIADGSMLLPSAPPRIRTGDSEHRYRPDSELLYVAGWSAPDCVALLRGFADEERFVLFVAERDREAERWTGPRPDLGEVESLFGADRAYPLSELRERAPGLIAGGEVVHYRLGASSACDDVARAALRRGRRVRARRGVGTLAVRDPGAVLDPMRAIKDEVEIACMRRAADVTVAAFRDALAEVRPGAGEWEIEAALDWGFRRRGGTGSAFATIVAGGANACTLHYAANDALLEADDLALLDAGAEFDWYAADVTRTVPVSGTLDGARRSAYEAVRAARDAAIAACRVGASLADAHLEASRVVAEALVELGVLSGSAEDALAEGAHREFFPHRTSHWLGLDVHDAGAYRDGAGPVALRPGMVFTVEPGLYFAPGSCPGVPELEGAGIRIEDDVLTTASGPETLTGALPTALEELVPLVGARGRA